MPGRIATTTKLSTAKKGSNALRTSSPIAVWNFLDLDVGDYVDWRLQVDKDGVRYVEVRKHK